MVVEIADARSPRYRCRSSRRDKALWVETLGELGQDCRDLIETTGVLLIADEIDHGRLDRRDPDRAAGRVKRLDGHLRDTLAREERDLHGTARDRPAVFGQGDLK